MIHNLLVTLLAGGFYLGLGFVAHGLLKREQAWEALGVPFGFLFSLLFGAGTLAGAFGGYPALLAMMGNGLIGPFAFMVRGGLPVIVASLAGGLAALFVLVLPGFRPAWWSFSLGSLAALVWVSCGWMGQALVTP